MADSFRSTATSLVRQADNLWTYEGSLKFFYGIFRIPSRMTVIRLPATNQLVVISPFPPTTTIQTLLDDIGEVQFIVIPNNHHTFWALKFLDAYPNAFLIATIGVQSNDKFNSRVHAYLTPDGLLTNEKRPVDKPIEWPADQIDYYCLYSIDFFHEVAFYHRASSTLILTDMAFNYSEIGHQPVRAQGFLFRLYLWLADGYRQACVTRPFKFFFRTNIDAVKLDFDQLMSRYDNFDRLVMAHGTVIHERGHEKLRSGTCRFVDDLYQRRTKRRETCSKKTNVLLVVLAVSSVFLVSRLLFSQHAVS